jgi:hypothetical protein
MIVVNFLRRHGGKILLLIVLLYVFGFIDDTEQCLGFTSGRMAEVQRMGRLASFPKERKDFKLWVSSGMIHSLWKDSFSARPEVVDEWLKNPQAFRKANTHKTPLEILGTFCRQSARLGMSMS